MPVIRSGHDIVSLFNSSWETQALVRERHSRLPVSNYIAALLLIVAFGLLLVMLQYFLNSTSNLVISESTQTNQAELVVSQPSQAVSEYVNPGPGYLGR